MAAHILMPKAIRFRGCLREAAVLPFSGMKDRRVHADFVRAIFTARTLFIFLFWLLFSFWLGWGEDVTNKFDPFGDLQRQWALGSKVADWSFKMGRNLRARSLRKQVEQLYGPEIADAVEAAVRSGRNPNP